MKRAGVVGLGKMGIVHASILNALPDVELVAVMDKDKSLRRYLYGIGISVPFYQSLREMLERAELDGVFLCVPSSANYKVAKVCVEKGVNIFVEKPLANNLASAERMMELVKDKDVKHSVGFMVAYVPTFRRAREILGERIMGEVRKIEASAYLSAVFSKQHSWFYRKETAGGGAMVALGSHRIFLLHWLFSPVRRVNKAELAYSSGNEVEDGGRVEMELEGGIEAKMDVSWSAPDYENMWLEIVAFGSEGKSKINNQKIEIQLKEEGITKIHISELPDEAGFYLGGEGYCREDEDFISSLGTDREPEVTWREGYHVQKILDAVYRSAETNQPVTP